MNKEYLIKVNGITVGVYQEEKHRDEAFKNYVKWGVKEIR